MNILLNVTNRFKFCFVVCFITSTLTFSLSFAQEPEPALAKAFYTLKHRLDTNKKDSIYLENMVLYIGKNASLFTSLDKIAQKKKIERDLEEQTKNWTGPGSPRFKSTSGVRKTSNQDIFQFQQAKKLFISEYLLIHYLYEDSLTTINWKLMPDSKSFGKIKCQKAVADYKGRKWEVWFAPDIPFEYGPWKLHGLPGLIMEAQDSTKQVQLLFNGFETIAKEAQLQEENQIKLPIKATKVKLSAITKLRESMYENPKGFFRTQLQATKGILAVEDVEGLSFKKINNPIELQDK